MAMNSEVSLDESISFGRRTTTRLPSDSLLSDEHERENHDFLSLITAVSNLYAQEDVLEVQGRTDNGKTFAHGAVSEVSTVYAAFTRPSTIISTQSRKERRRVVIKISGSKLFLPNGQVNNESAIKSFISEIRILSHGPLRRHPNIVKLLGVHWDYFHTGYPEPVMLLEMANMDLRNFQTKHTSLPFATKKSIALDIARGLSALHNCGVIHGDMKPDNVLVFFKPELHAKVSDFSHSFLDNGKTRQLVGGTHIYAAPEWKTFQTTSNLLKTDVYSFGLIFGGLLLGCDIVDAIKFNSLYMDLDVSRPEDYQLLKECDLMKHYLNDLIRTADQNRPELHMEELPMIKRILDSTVQLDPKNRSLVKTIQALSGGLGGDTENIQKVQEHLDSTAISIPYYALHAVSSVIKDQIVRALRSVADSGTDLRRAAACVDLAICYLSDFGVPGTEKPSESKEIALAYLMKGATLGDVWARAIAFRIIQATQQDIPETYPLIEWLVDAATKGSKIAFESLETVDHSLYERTLATYRSTFAGNPAEIFLNLDMSSRRNLGDIVNERNDTVLHWLVSTGQVDELERLTASELQESVINKQNSQGDTPLLCATRAGHYQMLVWLIERNADASTVNSAGENALHFLGNLDDDKVTDAAQLLMSAGADIDAEAERFTGNAYLESGPRGGGSPELRAVMSDKPHVLGTLLGLRKFHQPQEPGFNRCISASKQRLILAWAFRLNYVRILETIQYYRDDFNVIPDIDKIRVWSNGKRHSLIELCILGISSVKRDSGFDIPDRFWRYMNHGKDHGNSLERSLSLLASWRMAVLEQPCSGARNALFFAIKEGRRDAARYLVAQQSTLQIDLFTRATSRLARHREIRGEIQAHFMPLDGKPLKKGKHVEERGFGGRDGPSFLDKFDETSYGLENCEAYLPKQIPMRRRRSALNRGRRRFQPVDSDSDQSHDEFNDDYDDGEIEQSSEMDDAASDVSNIWTHPFGVRNLWKRMQQRTFNQGIETQSISYPAPKYEPRTGETAPSDEIDHYGRQGLVDAVLLSILHGHRGIFYDLITSVGCKTLRRGPASKHYVYVPKHNDKIADTPYDLRAYFPDQTWSFMITRSRPLTKDMLEFDGNLCYSLLYMTAIARSTHRDIDLANTLLSVLKILQVPEPKGWVAKNWFEDVCLSIDLVSGQTSPLFHSAALRWDELSKVLMEHGATPQGLCFRYLSNPSKGCRPHSATVLSRLIGATMNIGNEVQTLLEAAASLKLERIVTLEDINAIVTLQAHLGKEISWKHETLSWKNSSEWHHDYNQQLWRTLAIADASQKQKINGPGTKSKVILEAASRRDIWAVRSLLDMSINPNGYYSRWKVWELRVTPLDIVTWTHFAKAIECNPSGLDLKARDAEIRHMLISHGGRRGIEYMIEYQVLLAVLQSVLFPLVVTGVLEYAFYNLYSQVPGLWREGLEHLRRGLGETDTVSLGPLILFNAEKLVAMVWTLATTKLIIIKFSERNGAEKIDGSVVIIRLMGLGFIWGWLMFGVSVVAGQQAKAVLYFAFLFDATLYLSLILLFTLIWFVFIFFLYRIGARLNKLAELQGSCSLGLVWRATYSPTQQLFRRIKQSLFHALPTLVWLPRLQSLRLTHIRRQRSTPDVESEHGTPGFRGQGSLDAVEHMEDDDGDQDQTYQPLQQGPLATYRPWLQLPQLFNSLLQLSSLDIASQIRHKISDLTLGFSQKWSGRHTSLRERIAEANENIGLLENLEN